MKYARRAVAKASYASTARPVRICLRSVSSPLDTSAVPSECKSIRRRLVSSGWARRCSPGLDEQRGQPDLAVARSVDLRAERTVRAPGAGRLPADVDGGNLSRILSGGECVELQSAQGLGEQAGVASGTAFGWFLGLGFGDDVEAFALATVQIVGTGGDVKRLAIRVQRDDADVVPPLLPVDSVEAAQRGLVLSPGRFPFADVDDPADRAAVLGDELYAELFQPFHCAGFGLHGEASGDVSFFSTGEKVGLPCHGGQCGVVLQMLGVVPCGRGRPSSWTSMETMARRRSSRRQLPKDRPQFSRSTTMRRVQDLGSSRPQRVAKAASRAAKSFSVKPRSKTRCRSERGESVSFCTKVRFLSTRGCTRAGSPNSSKSGTRPKW